MKCPKCPLCKQSKYKLCLVHAMARLKGLMMIYKQESERFGDDKTWTEKEAEIAYLSDGGTPRKEG